MLYRSLLAETCVESILVFAANNPPRVVGNSTFRLHANVTSTLMFTVSDRNDTYTVSLMGKPPPPADYTFSRSGDEFNFTWTPSTFSSIRLVFVANDSSGAITVFHPEVRLCGCRLDLNATCIDSDADGGDDRFIMQDCQCASGNTPPFLATQSVIYVRYICNTMGCVARMGRYIL